MSLSFSSIQNCRQNWNQSSSKSKIDSYANSALKGIKSIKASATSSVANRLRITKPMKGNGEINLENLDDGSRGSNGLSTGSDSVDQSMKTGRGSSEFLLNNGQFKKAGSFPSRVSSFKSLVDKTSSSSKIALKKCNEYAAVGAKATWSGSKKTVNATLSVAVPAAKQTGKALKPLAKPLGKCALLLAMPLAPVALLLALPLWATGILETSGRQRSEY